MSDKRTKVEIDEKLLTEIIDKQTYEALCILTSMKPLVDTLYEYGITGMRATTFMMKFLNRSCPQNDDM